MIRLSYSQYRIKENYSVSEEIKTAFGLSEFGSKKPLSPTALSELGLTGYHVILDSRPSQIETETILKLSVFNKVLICLPACTFSIQQIIDIAAFFRDCNIEILCSRTEQLKSIVQHLLANQNSRIHLSILLNKKLKPKDVVSLLKNSRGIIFLYAPYQHLHRNFFGVKKIGAFLARMKELAPETEIRSPLTHYLHDDRFNSDLEPYQSWPCLYSQSVSSRTPKFSFIIPTFNNFFYLEKVLKNLTLLNRSTSDFEVVVIDDGSTDETPFTIGSLMETTLKSLSVKYVYFPRRQTREMGDARYRAGVARNIGYQKSRGEILCFLDSDILVSPEYLNVIENELKGSQVLQSRRLDLCESASEKVISFGEINPQTDVVQTDSYWDSFHRATQDWSEVPHGWKYTCTHSLTVKRETFKKVGGIRPCYIFYGFEDTDLGYALWHSGFKFKLLNEVTYHCFHKPNRSEFKRDGYSRMTVLRKTCDIFFRHHPTLENYEIFRSMLS